MQIKIAICDDEINICSHIKKILTKILTDKFTKFDIDVFCNGKTLCEEMEKTKYDLLFLDIELPNISGVEIGKYIREMKKDNVMQ